MLKFFSLILALAGSVLAASPSTDGRQLGSPTAPIVVEVYSDFQCPHCKILHFDALRQLIAEYVGKGTVRVVNRDFPLPQHPYARTAALYAEAAARMGKYERVADKLFQDQDVWGQSGDVEASVAKALSPTEMTALRKIVKDPKSAAEINHQIEADLALGAKIPLTQTPTLVVNAKGKTYPIVGAVTYDRLKILIDTLNK